MKNKQKLKQLQRQLTYANKLLQRICDHLGLSVDTKPISLTSVDKIMKDLYPTPFFGISKVREEIENDARMDRMEETASKMTGIEEYIPKTTASDERAHQEENNEAGRDYLEDNVTRKPVGHKTIETYIEEAHFTEPDERDVAQPRIPVNLRLGF